MSLLINNELIWISIPRCASHSIEEALLSSDLNIEKYQLNSKKHLHVRKDHLFHKFGNKETICIKRDPIYRWISALDHFFNYPNLKTDYKWEDLSNEIIYKIFSKELINAIVSQDFLSLKKHASPYFQNISEDQSNVFVILSLTLLSENYWKGFENCTYEFELNDLFGFENFIKTRFGKEIKLEHKNKSSNLKNKIILDDELKKWIFDNFEKPFIKSNKLI